MTRVAAVIMAGGRGERFWPASTNSRPKQFIDLTGDGTLIQQTVARISRIVPLRQIYVITGAQYLDMARAQLPRIPTQNFLVEPVGRDTAPCMGLAALFLERIDPDTVMVALPADHHIADEDRFCDLILQATEAAAELDHVITFGILPERPETGYGYIEMGDVTQRTTRGTIYRVRRFVEKPDRETAAAYTASGRFWWNSGIFVTRAATLRREIAQHLPELHAGLEQINAAGNRAEFDALVALTFPSLPKISIDYGVMERAERVLMIPGDFGWDDLGTWTAIARLRSGDDNGNCLSGNALVEDCEGVLVEAHGARIIAALGLRDVVIVDTDEALLVCTKEQAQHVRRLVERARAAAAVLTPAHP
jgi:mannose-1-phosphate guanylyltransferase